MPLVRVERIKAEPVVTPPDEIVIRLDVETATGLLRVLGDTTIHGLCDLGMAEATAERLHKLYDSLREAGIRAAGE